MLPVRRTNWIPSIFNDFFGNEWVERKNNTSPAVNIIENENEYKVEFAAPGATKEDFKIEMLDDNNLTISMEKKSENKEEKEGKYLRREFSHVSFRQSMILPDNIDTENIDAKVENGVLNITIPKKKVEEKASTSKLIDIK